jgi:hypothetical protein
MELKSVLLPELWPQIASHLKEDDDPTFVALSFTCKTLLPLLVCTQMPEKTALKEAEG